MIIALLAYSLIAPGMAQNPAIDDAGSSGNLPLRMSGDTDKNTGYMPAYSLAAGDGPVTSERHLVVPFVRGTNRVTYFNLTDWLFPMQTGTSSFSRTNGLSFDVLSPPGQNRLLLIDGFGTGFGGSGDSSMAGDTGSLTANDADAAGNSRYIVVFEDASPAALSMAKEQVKGLAESQSGAVIHDYSIINGMAVSVPDDLAAGLSSLDHVKYVEKDQLAYVALDKAVNQTGVDQVWDFGYDGSGVKVCVIDTGIDAGHPDLNNGKVVDWIDYIQHRTTPYDDNGHGTHCAGTIAGTGSASGGQYTGVAPGVSLMGAKVMSSGGWGRYTDIIAAINWAVTNHARVISMSLGGSHSQALDDAVNNAVGQGVTVVVAAGNDGQYGSGTIACPGDNPNVITVGAVDRNDVIAYFSSRGPTYSGNIKPDVTNMGVGLVAARASGTSIGSPVNSYYTALSGTSMATPMTAGVVALLIEKNASLTPAQLKDALTRTAKPLGSGIPNNVYGYGRVQARAAFDYVETGVAPPRPTPAPSPLPAPGGVPVIEWNQSFSQNTTDFGISGTPTADGGYAATGYTYRHGNIDVYLVKTNDTGFVTWRRTFGGQEYDAGYAIQQTSDHGYIIAGMTEPRNGDSSRVYLVRTDEAGTMLWNKTYSFSLSDRGLAVLSAGDGGYVVAGTSNYGQAGTRFCLFKTDAAGTLLWNSTAGAAYSGTQMTLQPAGSGYVLCGTYRNESYYNNTGSFAMIARMDGTGSLLWNRSYQIRADTSTTGMSAQQTADGGYVLTGLTYDGYTPVAFLLKTDASGNPRWNHTYASTLGAYGYDVRQVRDGGFIVTGFNMSDSESLENIYLLKTDGSGQPEWERAYEFAGSILSTGFTVRQTADDGYVICGTSIAISENIDADLVMIKTGASGVEQWRLACGEKCFETISWARPTDDGGYILTGTTDNTYSGIDASLVRLDRSGNLIWKQYAGGIDDDAGSMVLQNRDGGYVIAGTTGSTGTVYANAFLDGTDAAGNIEWEVLYGSDSDCGANAVLQTADDGYVLAGGRYDPDLGDCDAYLVKTDSRGEEEWNYTCGGFEDDWASSVIQNADGSYLFVGGTYSDGTGNCDIYVKLVYGDGSPGWGYYYYTDSDVWADSVIAAGDGGYLITGGALNGDGETKIVLLKIDRNGKMLWNNYYGNSSYQEGSSISATIDGGFLIGGTIRDDRNQSNRMMVMKTDAKGNVAWGPVTSGSGNTYGSCALQTVDGGFVMAGTSYADSGSQGSIVKLSGVAAPQKYKPAEQVAAPPMPPGFQSAGGITGRVTTVNTSVGIAGVDIYVVNASNTSQYYWKTKTNDQGYFELTDISNTWDGSAYQARYKVYAYDSLYGEAYSNNFTVEFNSNAWAAVMFVPLTSPVPVPMPPYPAKIVEVVPAPAMQGSQDIGAVIGRVTSFDSSFGMANTFVAIVNAYNYSQAYYITQTNSQGYFQFGSVNHTYDASSGSYVQKYKVYAFNSTCGEGYSNNFTVEPRPAQAAWAADIINLEPAKITITSSRYSIVANGSDTTVISAYATDRFGNPVSDNTQIIFRVNQSGWSSSRNGSLSIPEYGNVQEMGILTRNGYANVSFGRVDSVYAGNNSTVLASSSRNNSINASTVIAFRGSIPLLSHRPIQVVPAPAMKVYQSKGYVTGRVTAYNSREGIANAYVAVVNASNISQAFYVTQTNSQGFYQILDVNNTYNGAIYEAPYKLYACGGTIGEGYSNNFSVEVFSGSTVNTVLLPYNSATWIKPIDAGGICRDIKLTDDGGYILAGYTYAGGNDESLVKTDASGKVLWNHTYGGSDYDVGSSVQQTSDGGYILAGRSFSYDLFHTTYLIKTDAVGNVLWNKTLGGGDTPQYVIEADDGGFLVTGDHSYQFQPNKYQSVMYLMKTDARGNQLWYKNLTTTEGSGGDYIAQTADGGFIVAGNIAVSSTEGDLYMVKTDRYGNVQWDQTYSLPMWDHLSSVKQTDDGGFVIWSSAGKTSADSIMNLIKTNAAGTKLWNKTYNFTGNDDANSIILTSDGGFLAVYTSSPPYGTVHVMKMDSSGVPLWDKALDSLWSEAWSAVQSPDGSVMIVGDRWIDGNVHTFLAKVPEMAVTGPVPTPPYPGGYYAKQLVNAPAMQGPQAAGAVSGRVTTFNASVGIADAFVAILNAYNYSQAYYVGQTDANGRFQFTGINNTYNTAAGTFQEKYRIYVNSSSMGDGFSSNFSVEAGSTASPWAIIDPKPAHISISLERTGVTADGADTIRVSAYLTDITGAVVSNNHQVWFTINNGKAYANNMGSWSGVTGNQTCLGTISGFANATFGWVPDGRAGNYSILTVVSPHNLSATASITVNYEPVKVSWSGSVVNLAGDPAINVPVVLHVCGTAGEICALSAKTSDQSANQGCYSFDNIPLWPNVTYGYASVDWIDYDDIAYTGRSDNYTLTRSPTTADPIALQTPLPFFRTSWESASVGEGDEIVQYVYRLGDSSVPVSVQLVSDGGTAVRGVDFTTSPAMPCTLGFAAGETQKTFTIHVNPGSAGKYVTFRQANAIGAIADNTTYTLGISPPGEPVRQISYPAMSTAPDVGVTGGISGRVTVLGTDTGIADTDVWIVNAGNTSQYYSKCKTNAQGFFVLTNVNNTWVDETNGGTSPGGYQKLYRAYCIDSVWGANYSDNFTVEVNSNGWAPITIRPKPAHIVITTSKDALTTDGDDNLVVSAKVTDALNNPVQGSMPVLLTIYRAYAYNMTSMGRWGSASTQSIIVDTINGYANATYGWVSWKTPYDEEAISAISIIDPTINDVSSIDLNKPQAPGMTWTVSLKAGWNLVSLPVTPDNTSITSVIPPEALANIRIIWNYDNSNPNAPVWKFYKPGRAVNTLSALTDSMGFWVLANTDISFSVTGLVPSESHATFNKGWNMVGPAITSPHGSSQLYGSYYLTWGYKDGQWKYYKPSRTVNTLTEIKPGEGYWVLVT